MVKFRNKGDIFTLSRTHCAFEPYPAILLFLFTGVFISDYYCNLMKGK
jgi:hypothetical protein